MPHHSIRLAGIAIGLLCGAFPANAYAQTAPTPVAINIDTAQRLTEWVQAAESLGFSGTALVAMNGTVITALGVGSADLDGTASNTPETLFEVASITKQFTATALLQLVEQGKLSLDDSIAAHLPGVHESCRAITVRHLLQHTSGIPGTNSMGGGDDLSRVLPSFLRGGPTHTPGTHFEYWNQGYALLSEIIARASGTDYTSYCKEHLFARAGMDATCFTGDYAPEGTIAAIGRSMYGEPRSALEHPYGSYGFQYRGMGGVVTNVLDLWAWDRALHGDDILGTDAKATLFTPGLEDYAMGWYVKKTASGHLVQSHGGGVRGFASEMRRYPDDGGCIIVLGNRDDLPVVRIAQALEDIVFDQTPTYVKPPSVIDHDTRLALVGKYKDDKGNVLVVEQEGVVLKSRVEWALGQVTAGVLGRNEQNDGKADIVFYDWRSAQTLAITRDNTNQARRITILGMVFDRTG